MMAIAITSMQPWQAIEYAYDDRSGLYRRVKTEQVTPFVAAFAPNDIVEKLRATLPCPCMRVSTARELAAAAAKPGAIVFIDWDELSHIDIEVTKVPIIALLDDSNDLLARLIRTLDAYPWLSHGLAIAMLSRPMARAHLARLV